MSLLLGCFSACDSYRELSEYPVAEIFSCSIVLVSGCCSYRVSLQSSWDSTRGQIPSKPDARLAMPW